MVFSGVEMTEKENELLVEARTRFADCLAAQSEWRQQSMDDLKFSRLGEQWSKGDKDLRNNRPMLTINKTNTFNNYVVNEIKQNRSKPKARPFDDKADIDTANVISAHIDHIYLNRGEGAVDTAMDYAVSCSMGFFRVITDYVGDTFDQELIVKRIPNPFRVVMPFNLCEEEDFSDAPYCFIISKIKKEEFKKRYSKVDITGWDSIGEGIGNWFGDDYIVVAEYFKCDYEYVTRTEGDQTREYRKKKITWYKLCGNAVLSEKEWLGSYIPVIAIMGQEVDIDGKKEFISLTRFAKDPQKFFNYAKSCEAEVLGLAPKSPWLIAEGQQEGNERMWKEANTVAYSALVYKPITLNGQAVPPPQRIPSAQVPTGLANAAATASEDMKETIGLWSANLGASGNETSGKAINARARQGSTSNFHFYDNTNKALKYLGKILLELIPKVYTGPRMIRIMGEDHKEEIVRVNQQYNRNGKDVIYDLTAGQYDIVMDSGPSYASRRQEVEENLGGLMQKLPPEMGAAIADIYVRNMDFPDSSAMADRLRNMVPPQALKKEGDNKIDPAMVQQMGQTIQQQQQLMQQMDNTIQQMTKELADKDKDREVQIDKAILDNETKVLIEQMKVMSNDLKASQAMYSKQVKNMEADTMEGSAAPAQSAENIPPQ